jgi:hypothetical protein
MSESLTISESDISERIIERAIAEEKPAAPKRPASKAPAKKATRSSRGKPRRGSSHHSLLINVVKALAEIDGSQLGEKDGDLLEAANNEFKRIEESFEISRHRHEREDQ